jgi:hypothetical protein
VHGQRRRSLPDGGEVVVGHAARCCATAMGSEKSTGDG